MTDACPVEPHLHKAGQVSGQICSGEDTHRVHRLLNRENSNVIPETVRHILMDAAGLSGAQVDALKTGWLQDLGRKGVNSVGVSKCPPQSANHRRDHSGSNFP